MTRKLLKTFTISSGTPLTQDQLAAWNAHVDLYLAADEKTDDGDQSNGDDQ
jgi:hypothetical protein